MSSGRIGFMACLLTLSLAADCPLLAQPEAAEPARPKPDPRAQSDRDAARWADLEAQRRATDGDYDGAVQAHQQAEQALQEADRRQIREHLPPHRP